MTVYKRRNKKRAIKTNKTIIKGNVPKLTTNKLFIETQKPKLMDAKPSFQNPYLNPFYSSGFNPFFNPLVGLTTNKNIEQTNDKNYIELFNEIRDLKNELLYNKPKTGKEQDRAFLKNIKEEGGFTDEELKDLFGDDISELLTEPIGHSDGSLKENKKKDINKEWGLNKESQTEEYYNNDPQILEMVNNLLNSDSEE